MLHQVLLDMILNAILILSIDSMTLLYKSNLSSSYNKDYTLCGLKI